MHASNHVYLGTGAKGGDPPKNKIKTKPLAFCSGVNHGGLGGNPLTPNPTKSVQGLEADGAPKTKNRCKNRGKTKYRGGRTKPACPTTNYRVGRKKREVFRPQGNQAGGGPCAKPGAYGSLIQPRGRTAFNQGGKGGNPPQIPSHNHGAGRGEECRD